MEKAVFLDRDGTINVEVNYLHEKDKLVFIENVPRALRLLKDKGFKLIVISNQSGIGRGYYSAAQTEELHDYMNMLLEREQAKIDAFYYCPHVEADRCVCRKPQTGMYRQAIQEWDIDVSHSYMAGDKESDILAAQKIGCKYGLLLCGHDVSEAVKEKYKGHVYKDLWEFAQVITEEKNGME